MSVPSARPARRPRRRPGRRRGGAGLRGGYPSHHRALYDRVHRLVLEAHPGATAAMSYALPPEAAGRIDDELRDFLHATLAD